MPTKDLLKELFHQAKSTQANAYAPYSGFRIGASVLDSKGSIFSGCNIENASYGGTVCAERVAIFNAVSAGAKFPLKAICIISDSTDPWPPCGFCRQVLAEFSIKTTKVYLANPKGIKKQFKFSDLFPQSFTPAHLEKA